MSKEELTFEQALSELEKISKQLESQDVPLEEAIKLFEEGIKLSKQCSDMLTSAKQKVERISAEGGGDDD